MRRVHGLTTCALALVFSACSSDGGAASAVERPLLRFGSGRDASGHFNGGVRAIFEDRGGNFWFGSWQEGLARYDGQSLTYLGHEDGLSHPQIRSIQEDPSGGLWFETGFGVSHFDGTELRKHTRRDYGAMDSWRLSAGDLWFKSDAGHGVTKEEVRPGVYRYDGDRLRWHAFPDAPKAGKTVASYSVTGIARGQGGRVWIATYGGVFGYDGAEFTVFDDERLGLNADTGWLHVRCVFEDSRGRLWIGNNGIGVFMIDGEKIVNFTQANGVGRRDRRSGGKLMAQPGDAPAGEASLHRVFAIGEDRDGNIWFGTVRQGAWRYDGQSLRNFTKADGLDTEQVMAIYKDRRGDLWLGGDGVYRFNGTSFDRMH